MSPASAPWYAPQRVATYSLLPRLGCFVLGLALLWLPLAIPIYLWLPADANTVSIVAIALLGVFFIGLLRVWGKRVQGYRSVWGQYGLVATRRNVQELLLGLGLGWGFVLALFGTLSLLGWAQWQPAPNLWRWVLEGSLTALGVGLGEELCFRGWLLDELEQDYDGAIALWANSLFFAVLHFLKPWSEIARTFPQFPGLVILGLSLVWARRRTRYRLGQAIGLHAGLVWGYYVINVGNLILFTGVVPDWVTGVDQNPLAGLVGIGFLGLLALWVRWQPRSSG